MISPVIGVLRFLGFVLWTLIAVPPFLVTQVIRPGLTAAYTRVYWRVVMRIIGYSVRVKGQPLEDGGPVLFLPNHGSYLDIIVLGSLLKAFFVAKSEVAGWPGFGFLARISRTVFIQRAKGATHRESNAVRARLDHGDSLILFAEGTSNDGNRVLAFKSSFLAIAEADVVGPDGATHPVRVQPVSVAYARLDGFPMTRALRPFFAWYGDMTLAGHLLGALGMGKIGVDVEFHPPVTVAELGSRKTLAAHCHKAVAAGVTRMLAGR